MGGESRTLIEKIRPLTTASSILLLFCRLQRRLPSKQYTKRFAMQKRIIFLFILVLPALLLSQPVAERAAAYLQAAHQAGLFSSGIDGFNTHTARLPEKHLYISVLSNL